MITRIILENFMSHRRSVIEPAEGLTLLTGPNNCGKSAVVAALQILCSNESGAHKWCVRHGQKTARIVVETADRHRIEWVSESGKVHYLVDGERTDRLNRGLPDQLMPKLKLPEVVGDDGKTFDIHFAPQKDPIFLLGGGSRAATFFAASSDAGYLVKMQQLLRQRRSEQNGLQRELKARVTHQDALLERYQALPEIEESLADAQRLFEALEDASGLMRSLTDHVARLEHSSHEYERCLETNSCLRDLALPPAFEDAESLREAISRLEERATDAQEAGQTAAALADLRGLPELADAETLQLTIENLADKERHAAVLTARLACVANLPEPAEIEQPTDLMAQIATLESAQAALIERNTELALAEGELGAALYALRDHLRSNPTCPLCGGAIDADAVLSGGHVHA